MKVAMKRSSIAFGILLFSVVLVDCGSRMLGPDGDLQSEASAVVTAAGSIVPSQTVSSVTPGEVAGDFSVTESGQASYTVPLWTPEGPMGMSPSLALHYDSSGGAGPLGVGFSLTSNVISSITRCRKSIPIDGDVSPIELAGTTYCLDGKRLIPRSSAPSEYRTEEDDGSKILRLGTDPASPTGWIVYLRSGQILTYGTIATGVNATQLRGTVKATYCPAPLCDQAFVTQTGTGTLAWALEKVTDRVAQIAGAVSNGIGNYMTITYTTFSSGSTIKYGTDFDFKEMLISQIDYGYGTGTTAHRQVKFTYGKTRDDARYTWVSGVPIMSTKLLDKIEMLGPNPTAMQLLKTYNVGYHTVLGVSGRSRILLISECDNATPSVCKKFTQFNWENGSVAFRDVVDPTWRDIDPTSPVTVLDYNGDGKSDVMLRTKVTGTAPDYFQFYTSQMGPDLAQGGPDPSAPVRLEATSLKSEPEYTILGVSTLDLDGDARSDVAVNVKLPGGGPAYRQLFDLDRNAGNQFDYVVEPSPSGLGYDTTLGLFVTPVFPDLDGDGLPEQVQLGLVKANNPANSNQPDYSQFLLRRNYDLQTPGNLGVRNALTEGNLSYSALSAQYFEIGNGLRKPYSGYPTYVVDIDGSGRGALLIQDSWFDTSQPQPYVNALNTFNQMRAIQMTRAGVIKSKLPALAAYSRDASGYHYLWIDVNGDGLPDAIDVPNDVTNGNALAKCTDEASDIGRIRMNIGAGLKRYTGSQSEANAPGEYSVNARPDAGVLVGDINQDGLDDIVLTAKAIRYTSPTTALTDRDKMRMLMASTGTSLRSHLVVGPAPRTIDGLEIPAVDAALLVNSANNNEKLDASVPVALGDFNGDGLIDIVAVRVGKLHFYIHQGQKADLLKSVDTGTGRHLEIQYAPTTDPTVYRRMREGQPTPGTVGTGPWEQPPECKHPLNCLTGGRWVVSRYLATNDQKVNVGHHYRLRRRA